MSTSFFNPEHLTGIEILDVTLEQGEILKQLQGDREIHLETVKIIISAYESAVAAHSSGEAPGRDVMGLWIDGVADDLAVWMEDVREDLLDDPAKAERHDQELRAVAMFASFITSDDWKNIAAVLVSTTVVTEMSGRWS